MDPDAVPRDVRRAPPAPEALAKEDLSGTPPPDPSRHENPN
jgi:hypothetical protein